MALEIKIIRGKVDFSIGGAGFAYSKREIAKIGAGDIGLGIEAVKEKLTQDLLNTGIMCMGGRRKPQPRSFGHF